MNEVNARSKTTRVHRGVALRSLLMPQVRPIDIARQGGFTRQYVHAVLTGAVPPSKRFRVAARELGLPIDQLIPENPVGAN